jgi:hypothetical protein
MGRATAPDVSSSPGSGLAWKSASDRRADTCEVRECPLPTWNGVGGCCTRHKCRVAPCPAKSGKLDGFCGGHRCLTAGCELAQVRGGHCQDHQPQVLELKKRIQDMEQRSKDQEKQAREEAKAREEEEHNALMREVADLRIENKRLRDDREEIIHSIIDADISGNHDDRGRDDYMRWASARRRGNGQPGPGRSWEHSHSDSGFGGYRPSRDGVRDPGL